MTWIVVVGIWGPASGTVLRVGATEILSSGGVTNAMILLGGGHLPTVHV